MIDSEWLTWRDPKKMLVHLHSKTSDRKLRLFTVACCRRIWHLMPHVGHSAVESAEGFADETVSRNDAWDAFEVVERAFRSHSDMTGKVALLAASHASHGDWERAAANAAGAVAWAAAGDKRIVNGVDTAIHIRDAERAQQAWLLADICGIPPSLAVEWTDCKACGGKGGEGEVQVTDREKLRTVTMTPWPLEVSKVMCYSHRENEYYFFDKICHSCKGKQGFIHYPVDQCWLRWNDATVVRLAQRIYYERRFADLPILADALEEAGCTNADILDHCRRPGPHVRGCWVVDLVLGKD